MTKQDKSKAEVKTKESAIRLFTEDGKPIRVLSTSLGIALLANTVLSTGVSATSVNASSVEEPELVSWSTEEVKAYFDKNIDWSLPLPPLEDEEVQEEGATGGAGSGDNGSEDTTVIHHYGSGFGWDDLLLYHLLFNRGSSYSSGDYYRSRKAYYTNSKTAYTPKTYTSSSFQNKQVAGSNVRPKTSTSTGSITRRSTSTSAGSIGGKSSSLSSSGSSSSKAISSSSSKSSGFGG